MDFLLGKKYCFGDVSIWHFLIKTLHSCKQIWTHNFFLGLYAFGQSLAVIAKVSIFFSCLFIFCLFTIKIIILFYKEEPWHFPQAIAGIWLL